MTPPLSRRAILATGASAALATGLPAFAQTAPQTAAGPVRTKPIPSSKEALPIVGIGTAIIFDYQNDPAKQAERAEVLKILTQPGGGKLIDTAPSYGAAEDRLGELIQTLGIRDKVFLATKIPTRGADRAAQIASMEQSKVRLKTQSFDLMQAWNVSEANYDLGLLRDWKARKICRYTGITSSMDAAYDALEQAVRAQKPDFFQINYSLADRDAEARLIPAAADAGCAILTNLPFGRNSMFAKVAGKPLPDFAKEFDAFSWGQFFLKYLLSHPAVTAVIPGTDKPQYMVDNLGAGRGRLPDAALRKRMVDYFTAL
jgi:aryl-alcohol dehydrogenase-like predicted oxidoreductase